MRQILLAVAIAALPASVAAEVLYTRRLVNEIRVGPGSYYSLRGTLPRGAAVSVVETRGAWARFELEGAKGPFWMAASSLGREPGLVESEAEVSQAGAICSPAVMITAVRGFALRYGRATGSDLAALERVKPPFFAPEEYLSFKGEPRGFAATAEIFGASRPALEDYDPSPAEEGTGLGIAARVAARGLDRDRARLRYLNLLGTFLAESSGAARPFRIYATSGPELNAVAVPGGHIFVSRALLSACPGEAELAAVLAHEMIHVARRHGLKEIKVRETGLRADEAIAELEAEAGPSPDDAEEAVLTELADAAYEAVHKPRLQKYEEEADEGAILILGRAGYDPRAVPRMISCVARALERAGAADGPLAASAYKARQEKAEAFLRRVLGGRVDTPPAGTPATPGR